VNAALKIGEIPLHLLEREAKRKELLHLADR